MKKIKVPYGTGHLETEVSEERISAELLSEMHYYEPTLGQEELVKEALANPIGSPKLSLIAEGKEKVVIIASDHTRPVPDHIIMPLMLKEIRKGNPDADITILIATGCHREMTKEELLDKFGKEIIENEKFVVHDSTDDSMLVKIGYLPSGGELIINKLAADADLLVSTGFIEPHFFAGFSGGRKSVFPGVTSKVAVMSNHNAEFIDSPYARTGIIENNPIHRDMLYGARASRLDFICNVVLNSEKEIIYAVAGDCNLAHIEGRDFLSSQCKVKAVPSDIVISTNGGYPLDQNIYQAVKGMTAAEATVKKDGVIIMIAKSNDGHGGEQFYKTFKEEKDLDKIMKDFLKTPKEETIPDQWQSQIFARVLQHARVVYVSDAPDEMVEDLHMIPAHSLEEAIEKAEKILDKKDAKIAVIPDGVSVMVI